MDTVFKFVSKPACRYSGVRAKCGKFSCVDCIPDNACGVSGVTVKLIVRMLDFFDETFFSRTRISAPRPMIWPNRPPVLMVQFDIRRFADKLIVAGLQNK